MASSLIGLATISANMCDFDNTIRFAKKAIREADLVRNFLHKIAGEELLSVAYKMQGGYDEAESHQKTAFSLCKE
jgi:hypothetical protein